MTDVIVFPPRDTLRHSRRECRLSLPAGRGRTVIVGPDGIPPRFRTLPGEIVEVSGTPKALVRDGADPTGQLVLENSVPA